MRAAVFRDVGKPFEICELPDPVPGDGDVVIAVRRCGICASDLHFTDGHSDRGFAPGRVLGHEVAGEVVAVGKGVSRVKVSDRVAPMIMSGCGLCESCWLGRPSTCAQAQILTGGYAEYCVAGANGLIVLPDSLSEADGALIEPLAVALRTVLRAGVTVGSRVLVIGAGPIGLNAIFWARHLGALRIAVGELERSRETHAMVMGADAFLVAQESGRTLGDLAKEALAGMPDVVIECVGVPGMLDLAVCCVAPGGTIAVAGWCLVPDSFIPSDANLKEARILFSSVYNLDEYTFVARTLDRGLLQPRVMITETISLEAMPAMIEMMRGKTSHVKVQVDPTWKATNDDE